MQRHTEYSRSRTGLSILEKHHLSATERKELTWKMTRTKWGKPDLATATDDGHASRINRRELTAEEREEMRMLAKNATSGLTFITILFTVSVLTMVGNMVVEHNTNALRAPIFYLGVAVTLLLWRLLIIGWRKGRMIRRALTAGFVVILHGPDAHARLPNTLVDDNTKIVIEAFPLATLLIWTINGVPAHWRTAK